MRLDALRGRSIVKFVRRVQLVITHCLMQWSTSTDRANLHRLVGCEWRHRG